jgi:predicted dehydrogenase
LAARVHAAGSDEAKQDRPPVKLAIMGVNSRGKQLLPSFVGFPEVEIAYICDPDRDTLPSAVKIVEDAGKSTPKVEKDFRVALDDPSVTALVCAAPDHWHALATILACQAGKDVYVEKPVSHSLAEGPAMIAAAQRHRRVVQSGLQQRSGDHFRSAVEFVQSGRLGSVHLAKAWTVHQRKSIGLKKNVPAPAGVDYDLWLGPAPSRPFNPNRFHYNWHWFWEYGTGELGNWGVHLLDVARWGLGVEFPTQVSAIGGKHHFHDDQQTPDTLLVNYAYRGKTITWEHRLWSAHGMEGRSAAVAFCGDRGTLIVDRGGWKVYGQKESVAAGPSDLLEPHLRNFVDCVRSRAVPACSIETGHVSSALCHLGNIAYRVERSIHVNPESGTIADDPTAGQFACRNYRAPWTLPVA